MTPTDLQRIIEFTVTKGSGYSESYEKAPTTPEELSKYLGCLEVRKRMLYVFVVTPIMVEGLEKCITRVRSQNQYIQAAEDRLRKQADEFAKNEHSQYLPRNPLIN